MRNTAVLILAFVSLDLAAVPASGQQPAFSRDQIRIVGSTAALPYLQAVSEAFTSTSGFDAPAIESTGTSGGLQIFCAGIGPDYPDLVTMSRRIRESEHAICQANGVGNILEVPIGAEALVLANGLDGPDFVLTLEQLWRGLADQGTKPATWREIDSSLPDVPVEVWGPSPTSGQRDMFEGLVMLRGCEAAGGENCTESGRQLRSDGAFKDLSPDRAEGVALLQSGVIPPEALAIIDFQTLEEVSDQVKAAAIDGVKPDRDTITSGEYPVSETLYVYFKRDHVGSVSGLQEFAEAIVSDEASGADGYLEKLGLIPLSEDRRARTASGMANPCCWTENDCVCQVTYP